MDREGAAAEEAEEADVMAAAEADVIAAAEAAAAAADLRRHSAQTGPPGA